jgi:hypothetical protein
MLRLLPCDAARWSASKPNKVLMRSNKAASTSPSSSGSTGDMVKVKGDSAFCKMDLKGGVSPDGGIQSGWGYGELIWSLVGIRVTNTASPQIAYTGEFFFFFYSIVVCR